MANLTKKIIKNLKNNIYYHPYDGSLPIIDHKTIFTYLTSKIDDHLLSVRVFLRYNYKTNQKTAGSSGDDSL